MVNLLASLSSVEAALRSYQNGLTVSQNNVANASTPGYAKQRATLEALPFQPQAGLIGGVTSGDVQNTRSLSAERAVHAETSAFGKFAQQAESLTRIEGVFDISGEFGIPAALNELTSRFEALSASPSSAAARQSVLDAAASVASGFNRAGEQLVQVRAKIDQDLAGVVNEINQASRRIHEFNENVLRSSGPDAGLESGAFSAAETLSQLVNIDVKTEANGTLTVLLGGQVPLVMGNQHQDIGVDFIIPPGPVNPGAAPAARIIDASGRDITGVVARGRLDGLLHVREQVLPAIAGDTQQDGSLNLLARGLADRVNQILTAGFVSEGPPPVPGTPLFTYDPSNPTDAARSLAVDPTITPSLIAVISPGPPLVANGAALELAGLGNASDPQNTINGMTFLEFYASVARDVGERLNTTRQAETRATLMVNQTVGLREEISGVSLNEEAVRLTQFQRAYEAAAQIVRVIDELLQTVLSLRR